MHNLFNIRTRREIETRLRIEVAVAAWAYEHGNESHLMDSEYDRKAYSIDLSIDTSRPDLDTWFRANFTPDTGQWVRSHPEQHKLERLYHAHYARR